MVRCATFGLGSLTKVLVLGALVLSMSVFTTTEAAAGGGRKKEKRAWQQDVLQLLLDLSREYGDPSNTDEDRARILADVAALQEAAARGWPGRGADANAILAGGGPDAGPDGRATGDPMVEGEFGGKLLMSVAPAGDTEWTSEAAMIPGSRTLDTVWVRPSDTHLAGHAITNPGPDDRGYNRRASARYTAERIVQFLNRGYQYVVLDYEGQVGTPYPFGDKKDRKHLNAIAKEVERIQEGAFARCLIWLQTRNRSENELKRVARLKFVRLSGGIIQPMYIGKPREADGLEQHVRRYMPQVGDAQFVAERAGVPVYGMVNLIRTGSYANEWTGELISRDEVQRMLALCAEFFDGAGLWHPTDDLLPIASYHAVAWQEAVHNEPAAPEYALRASYDEILEDVLREWSPDR